MANIVKYHLKQETPMWHFQHREHGSQAGATLRGSDVKPRLDKFLIDQMNAEGVNWQDYRISAGHDALNYKVQIVAKGISTKNDMGTNAFFFNMWEKVDKELAVFYLDGIDVKITCFIQGLMEQIDKHIQGFFAIHNFGTRQDKGFGSFVVDRKDGKSVVYGANDIENVFLKYAPTEHYTAYKVDISRCDGSKPLDCAYVLYQWMKAGINIRSTYKKSLITTYMLDKQIGGEKRWLKEKGIAPKVRKEKGQIVEDTRTPEGTVSEYRYIRAMLGVSGDQSWVTTEKYVNKNGKLVNDRATIKVNSKTIERFQSPITIKLISGNIFFIVYDLTSTKRSIIFGQRFEFSKKKSNKSDEIMTLDSFDMEDFMEYCAKEVKNNSFSLLDASYQFEMKKIIAGGNN